MPERDEQTIRGFLQVWLRGVGQPLPYPVQGTNEEIAQMVVELADDGTAA